MPKNPNPHRFNNEDGGRRSKQRNISKISLIPNGKEKFKDCCIDLFGAKEKARELDFSSMKKIKKNDFSISKINEENLEESPDPAQKLSQQCISSHKKQTSMFQLNEMDQDDN